MTQSLENVRAPEVLPVPLYHGTSTLFLARIIEHGLGGDNPIERWHVLKLARQLRPLVEEHLAHEDDWIVGAQSFGWMCEQRSGNFNFQHGHTYLSPSIPTAVRYATDKRYGSELLSYTLEFLGELVRRNIIDRRGPLSDEYSELFHLLRGAFSPMLVEVTNVLSRNLLDEHGNSPHRALAQMQEFLGEDPQSAHSMLQQTNFRMTQPPPLADLTFWMLDLQGSEQFMSGVARHLLFVPGSRNGGLAVEPQCLPDWASHTV